MTNPTRKWAAVYARFSSDKQNERSIDDQVDFCRGLCERAGYTVADVYSDKAVSGASTIHRPGWQQLMHDAIAGKFSVVVIEDIDRCFRDEADYHIARKRLSFLEIDFHSAGGIVSRIEGSIRALQGAIELEKLAQKTHRGQKGAVQRGNIAGGRSYGYRPVKGQPGKVEIIGPEAMIIRRIFQEYVAGVGPREIVRRLNNERIPAPRGGKWRASTIIGSRKRANGILQNALYNGEIVWNRQRFRKNPDTDTRVSRPNPESDWVRTKAPEMRIVDSETFQAAQCRRAERGGEQRYVGRPRHLLSGLIKCGCCDSTYIVAGKDKRGTYLRCSGFSENGSCENRRTIGMAWLEAKVLDAIEHRLAAPDLIAEYVREYHRLCKKALGDKAKVRARLERQLIEVKAECNRIVDAILAEEATRTLSERLTVLEARRAELESNVEAVAAPVVEIHPRAGDVYRRQVADLKGLLAQATPEKRLEAQALLRSLIAKIVVRPLAPYGVVEFDVYGALASLLVLSQPKAKKAAIDGDLRESMGVMVAGVGFEPTTFRL
jgi:site-specific DNA recombinase